jgi:hypothetical protein
MSLTNYELVLTVNTEHRPDEGATNPDVFDPESLAIETELGPDDDFSETEKYIYSRIKI